MLYLSHTFYNNNVYSFKSKMYYWIRGLLSWLKDWRVIKIPDKNYETGLF
jgi:hypothetical protein